MEVEPRFPAYAANNWPYTWRLTHHSPGHQADNMLLVKLITSKVKCGPMDPGWKLQCFTMSLCLRPMHLTLALRQRGGMQFASFVHMHWWSRCNLRKNAKFEVSTYMSAPGPTSHLGKYSDDRWWSSWFPFSYCWTSCCKGTQNIGTNGGFLHWIKHLQCSRP